MNTSGLLSHQIEPAHRLIDALSIYRAALDAGDCGCGKTWTSAACIRHLELPTLCVVPKIAVSAWKGVLATMGTSADVLNYEAIRTGKTPFGTWDKMPPAQRLIEHQCEACQQIVDPATETPCRMHSLGIHCISPKKVPHDYGKFRWNDVVKLLVFDEVHVCSGLNSLNSDMLVAAKRQGILTLALSATAVESPLSLRALGYVLGLHCLVGPNGFYSWAMKRGCRRPVFGGLEFWVGEDKKKQILSQLHAELFPSRGVRIRISEIPNFPKLHVTADLFDLENSGRIDELYAEVQDALSALDKIKLGDKAPEHPLTKLLRASQAIELLKVSLYLAIRQEAIDAGRSVAIFVSYRQTMVELLKRCNAVSIYGGQNAAERDENILAFQENRVDTLVAILSAGGQSISLHDLLGRPRTGIISLHPSAIKTKQVLGRLARAGGKSAARYIFPLVANSLEERLHKKLSAKLDCIDLLNNGDLLAVNLPISVKNIEVLFEE